MMVPGYLHDLGNLHSNSNNVLLVKIEGPVWYTIYHHLLVVKGASSNPSINQPTNGKRTSMIPSAAGECVTFMKIFASQKAFLLSSR